MSIIGEKLKEYASVVKKGMVSVVQSAEDKHRQAEWEKFVDSHLPKLYQFHKAHPNQVLPVAFHTVLKKWVWLSRADQRKMNRINAKKQRRAILDE